MSETEYIIWEVIDPRILGDDDSEVSRSVIFVGTEEEALKTYHTIYKQGRKFAGSEHIYQTYPQPNQSLQVGEKQVLYPERERGIPKLVEVTDDEEAAYEAYYDL